MVDEKIFKKINGITKRLDNLDKYIDEIVGGCNHNFKDIKEFKKYTRTELSDINKDLDVLFQDRDMTAKLLKKYRNDVADCKGWIATILFVGGTICLILYLHKKKVEQLERRIEALEAQNKVLMDEEFGSGSLSDLFTDDEVDEKEE